MDRGGKDLQHDGQVERTYSMMDRGGKDLQQDGQRWKGHTAGWTDHGKMLQHD